jgi:transposase-like protein
MRGIKVPEPVKTLIIERVKNGERVDDIAIEFNLYPNTIRKWLSDLQIGVSVSSTGDKSRSEALEISKLKREKQQLLEIIGELTVLTRQSKKKSKGLSDS